MPQANEDTTHAGRRFEEAAPHRHRPLIGGSPEPASTEGAVDSSVTDVLLAWSDGDAMALERLIPLVVEELRRVAHGFLRRETPGHTLQPTALVNELYLRLAGRRRVAFANRAHFFGFAAQTMRRILVDHARLRQTAKRGHGTIKVPLEDVIELPGARDLDLVRLDDALATLAEMDPRQSRIVELHFFVGLTFEEIAELLGLGVTTVGRDWATARAWLLRELSASAPPSGDSVVQPESPAASPSASLSAVAPVTDER